MIRLIRNLRYTPRERPVISHRRTLRVENFGVIFDLLTCAFVAIQSSFTFSIIPQARGASGLACEVIISHPHV